MLAEMAWGMKVESSSQKEKKKKELLIFFLTTDLLLSQLSDFRVSFLHLHYFSFPSPLPTGCFSEMQLRIRAFACRKNGHNLIFHTLLCI